MSGESRALLARRAGYVMLVVLTAGAGNWSSSAAHAQMTMPGQFAVSQGAATYSIPIQLPPGLNGAQPALSIEYSSQAGNGLAGVGWGLGGLTSISRCPKTKAQDGGSGTVSHDLSDRYCLNGQRLLLVSGTEGSAGAEYRTERESFSKVVAYAESGAINGPGSFLVKTAEGLTMEYGKTSDSRIEAQGKTVVAEWALNKLSDTKGNYYTVAYTEDNANGEYYPSRIDFSGNSLSNPVVAPQNVVLFEYETRPDQRLTYRGGSLNKSTKRLKVVRIQSASGTLIKTYTLSYRSAPQSDRSNASVLSSVQECASTGICMPSTTFSWKSAQAASWATSSFVLPEFLSADSYPDIGARLVDLNGDGLVDFAASRWTGGQIVKTAHLNRGSYWERAPQFDPPEILSADPVANVGSRFIDLNGDGLEDFIISRYTGGTPVVGAWLNTGNGWTPSASYQLPLSPKAAYLSADMKADIGATLTDINGDGLPDFVAARWISSGNYTQLVLLNTGNGWVEAPQYILPEFLSYDPVDSKSAQLIDLNGDGLKDFIVSRYTGGTPVVGTWLNNGNGWTKVDAYSLLPFQAYLSADQKPNIGAQLVDLNGDGLPDFVAARWMGSGAGQWTKIVLLNTGAGWVSAPQYILPEYLSADPVSNIGAQLVDINGDGLPDFIHSRNSGGNPLKGAWLNTGNGWGQKDTAYTLPDFLSADAVANIGTQLIDMNGDGLPDFVGSRWAGGSQSIKSTAFNVTERLVLDSVTSGLGMTTQVVYSTLPKMLGGRYKKELSSAYPKVVSVPPALVVTDVVASNGLGGSSATGYWYASWMTDIVANSRGVLGFEWTQSQNMQTGSVSRTYYRQDWPYLGLVREAGTGTSETNWKNLTYTVNTGFTCRAATGSGAWAACTTPSPNTRYFIYPNQIDTQAWDYSGMTSTDGVFIALPRTRTTQSLNDYGEVTQLKIETLNPDGSPSGYSKTTTNTYAPVDSTKWHLNRLVRSTVTANSP